MMITYQGERVTLNGGSPSIYSIGVSLGRIARFCGHTNKYYTVLCHSLVVSEIMEPELAIYGLMHDAQESLVGDVPTPMKTQVARNRESVLLRNIYLANGLGWPIPDSIQDAVDEADHRALVAEAHVLGHPAAEQFFGKEHDAEAARRTRKYLKKVAAFLDPNAAGPLFERRFELAVKDAGLLNYTEAL